MPDDRRLIAPAIAVATVGGHFVGSVCAPPPPDIAAQLEAFVRRHSPGNGKFAYYLRVGEGASPPDEPTREQLRALGHKLTPRVAAISAVIEIPGFVGAAVRSVITGMSLVFGRTVKIRASSDARDAALAVEPVVREAGLVPLDAETLERTFAALAALR
jgi:hypothetical protein